MKPEIETLPRGLDALWLRATGRIRACRPYRRQYLRSAAGVIARGPWSEKWSDFALMQRLSRISIPFRLGRDSIIDRILAAAAIREVIRRRTHMELFQVQIAGALALYDGHFVEMATGEGKSITAVIPAVLNGWRRRGCHVITVNDYLAERDAREFRDIYAFAGLSVAFIKQEMDGPERRAAYTADITYATNKEICADYLRDGLLRPAGMPGPSATDGNPNCVQRGLFAGIVDEADSVLIDEAVTPLIISADAANPEQAEAWRQAAKLADGLQLGRDYRLTPQFRTTELTDQGRKRVAITTAALTGIWRSARRSEELIRQTLSARHFYLRDKQYVVHDGKIVIVDESTGRLMPDRHWTDGLHQAVEAREGLVIQPMKETLARISFQNFFRTYQRLCGMSGTLAEVRGELWQVYRRTVVRMAPNRPCIRTNRGLRLFTNDAAKWRNIVRAVQRIHTTGQPILAGTRSVHASEQLSERLGLLSLPHKVLNARRHAEEAQIIAAAGESAVLTVATNMAGRGTDIRLTTTAREAGGLCVVATELHESARVDRQLAGRAGRQGDPGDNITFASLEDQLFQSHGNWAARAVIKLLPTDCELPSVIAGPLAAMAQQKAQRRAAAQRWAVIVADEQLDESLAFACLPPRPNSAGPD